MSLSAFQGPAYYLHNGSLAFNLALLLALGLPLLAALQHLCRRTITIPSRRPTASVGASADARQSAGQRRKGWQGALSDGGFGVQSRGVAALAPLWLWLTVISLLPHKEERFLYVVYPLVSPGMTRRHLVVSSGPSHHDLLASQMCEACSAALQHVCVTTSKLAVETRQITPEVTCCCRSALLQRCRLAQSGTFRAHSCRWSSPSARRSSCHALCNSVRRLSNTTLVHSAGLLACTEGCDFVLVAHRAAGSDAGGNGFTHGCLAAQLQRTHGCVPSPARGESVALHSACACFAGVKALRVLMQATRSGQLRVALTLISADVSCRPHIP